QSDSAKIRLVNNTYVADLDQRTAAYLNAQGLQVVAFGTPTGYASRTKVILYTSKLYALRYVKDLFGLESPQIVIRPDPASKVDMEIQLGEDWAGGFPDGE
ncbi:MAG: LytR C-terminal domain-containing protein, partial [Nitrospira sp.]|nr:LytR C-terminal domain-containing protein [Nitrospira sp.]